MASKPSLKKIKKMKNDIDLIKKFIKKNFEDYLYEDSEDKKDAKKILKKLNVPEDHFFYYYYSTYDAGEIYVDERDDEKVFYEMLYIDNLQEEREYLDKKFKLAPNFLPITSTEGDGCTLYNVNNRSVADVTFDQFTELENGEFIPQWNSFEEFLIDFLNIK